MVNRYTVNVVLRKQAHPQIATQEDIVETAIIRARARRPMIKDEDITDVLVGETENNYVVKVNFWPERGDQI